MAYGVQQGFDAAMFIGYHSAAGRNGNPLSHTFSRRPFEVRLNGRLCSEFMLFSLVANYEKVPPVLLTGDKMLCEDSAGMYPLLKTVAVKDGFGSMTRSIHPELACERIREAAREALSQDLTKGLIPMPEKFVFEVTYKEHENAVSMSYYPGFTLVGDRTIRMETTDYVDVVRAVKFVAVSSVFSCKSSRSGSFLHAANNAAFPICENLSHRACAAHAARGCTRGRSPFCRPETPQLPARRENSNSNPKV